MGPAPHGINMRSSVVFGSFAILLGVLLHSAPVVSFGLSAGVVVPQGLRTSSFSASALAPSAPQVSKRQIGWSMMGKQAAFGPFTPIVVATRQVVGEKRFNQIRGKGITLHSQVITEFCMYAGVPKSMRQGLIRLAKTNGNTLGFLS